MTPYYEHGGITIYHGDCREVITSLRKHSLDVIVTDPPYGVRWEGRARNFDPIANDHSTEAAVEALRLALPILKPKRHFYAFGRYDLSALPIGGTSELIWDKAIAGVGANHCWGHVHEYIQFGVYVPSKANREDGEGRLAARLRRGSVLRVPRLNSRANDQHPTEKPILLLRQLIEASSCFSEVVLDPFIGSGSTAIAAFREGRGCVGIEIEERYCEIAAKRLEQEVLPLEQPA